MADVRGDLMVKATLKEGAEELHRKLNQPDLGRLAVVYASVAEPAESYAVDGTVNFSFALIIKDVPPGMLPAIAKQLRAEADKMTDHAMAHLHNEVRKARSLSP